MASPKVKKQKYFNYTSIGWREWIYLPKFDDFAIKAKVDTGARTSALHATQIKEYDKMEKNWLVSGCTSQTSILTYQPS